MSFPVDQPLDLRLPTSEGDGGSDSESSIIDVVTIDEGDTSVLSPSKIHIQVPAQTSPKHIEQQEQREDEDEDYDDDRLEDDDDDRLEDDDYDLLEENLGVKIRRRYKRVKRIVDSDSEESSQEQSEKPASKPCSKRPKLGERRVSVEEESEDSDDNFIVDDNDQPILRQITAAPQFSDETVREAKEIFGGDFDYGHLCTIDSDNERSSDDSRSDYEEDISSDEGDPEERRSTTKSQRRKRKGTSFEPVFLEEAGISDEAATIRSTDVPERYQLRRFPLHPTGPELNEEVMWIFKQGFAPSVLKEALDAGVTNAEDWDEDVSIVSGGPGRDWSELKRRKTTYLSKIQKIVRLIRDEKCEVPYIYFYRKEVVKPELSVYDLWTIYSLDEEYCRMHQRQQRLLQLFVNMKAYQEALGEQFLFDNEIRRVTDEDVEDVGGSTSVVELDDLGGMFSTYYGDQVGQMREAMKKREVEMEVEPAPLSSGWKRSTGGQYRLCIRLGIHRMLPLFGLSAEEFGHNLESNKLLHSVIQTEVSLADVLNTFAAACGKDAETVSLAGKHMLAINFAKDFRVRRTVRKVFLEKATISVCPTRRGLSAIDENHPLFSLKFLKEKPVGEMDGIEFLELTQAEKEGLIKMEIGTWIPARGDAAQSLVDQAKTFFKSDSEDAVVAEWNGIREKIVDLAFTKFLYPDLRAEVRHQLLKKAMKRISERCCDKIYDLVKSAPYTVKYERDNEEGDWDTSDGVRVMALAYEHNSPVDCVVLDRNGLVQHRLTLTNLLTRRFRGTLEDVDQIQEEDRGRLRQVVEETKPHVVVIGGECRGALTLEDEVRQLLFSFPDTHINFKVLPVLILDNEVAKVYSRTATAKEEFPCAGDSLRQAVSLGRYVQDPLHEVAQLFNRDQDILCLHLDKYQRHLAKEELWRCLEVEMVNRACETGVDINDAVAHPHRSHLLQFVAGFGFHKATALLRKVKKEEFRIVENRADLATKFGIGPCVYKNAAGFIRFRDTLPEDAIVDPRDQTRIHPQHYGFALAVARAALSQEEEATFVGDCDIMERVMVEPECLDRLVALDLTKYIDTLRRQGYGDLTLLLNSIVTELAHPYHEVRAPFQVPDPTQIFYILTKEREETVREGKLVTAYMNDVKRRKPTLEDWNEVDPFTDPATGHIICPFCELHLPQVESLWEHFDLDACPGEIYAVHISLGNGITGIIPLDKLGDKVPSAQDILRLVSLRLPIQVRILSVDTTKFFLKASATTADLHNHEYMPIKDPYYDEEAESERMKQLRKVAKPLPGFVRRNVTHPSYKNITFTEAEEMLRDMDQGDVIFRPSTKGFDVLTLSWNVAPGVVQHLNIVEKDKRSESELGSVLSIGNVDFEDLDEIIVRFVNPQAAFAREMIRFKYFKREDYESLQEASKYLQGVKDKKPNRTHYVLTASRRKPGQFILSYLPFENKVFQEVVGVTAEGIWLRNLCFQSLDSCLHFWKAQFKSCHSLLTGKTAASIVDSVVST